jgi:hypothetical protein
MERNYRDLYVPIAAKTGYMPSTTKDPATGITHLHNELSDELLTECGLDNSKWIGFDESYPTYPVCNQKLTNLIEAHHKE